MRPEQLEEMLIKSKENRKMVITVFACLCALAITISSCIFLESLVRGCN